MALINPDGMFYGDRMALLSDKARLLWPHVFIASNTVGRIEINYRKVLNRAFADFKQNPFTDEAEFMGIMGEYFDAFLLYTYEQDGQVWGQWDIDKKMLPRFPLKADTKTPEPPENEFADWKKVYRESKRTKPFNLKTFTIPPRKSVETRENASGVGVGGGIGGGEGIGKNKTLSKDKPSTDVRRKDFIEALEKYWSFKNPKLKFDFSAKDGRALNELLRDKPSLSLVIFRECLNNRARSTDTVHAQSIFRWIRNITDYTNTPLDRFGKVPEAKNGTTSKAQQRNIGNLQNIAQGFGVDPNADPGGGECEDHSDPADGRALEGNTKPV